MKHTLLFATIASFVVVHAYANNIVTSKTYVDNRDALKVDIAQGVGTNNANVGKTLVVNSSGNLELGTPAAGNYVEDSITDGVTNKAPSENAVHDALAGKQDTITGYDPNNDEVQSVLTDTTNDGSVGKRAILDMQTYSDALSYDMLVDDQLKDMIPDVGLIGTVLDEAYSTIDGILNNMPSVTPITWNSNDATAVNNYSTSFTGTGNWPSAHEDQYVTGSSLAQGLALKQNKITTAEVDMNGVDLPALVSYDTTNGLVGNRIGILDQGTIASDEGALQNYDVYGVEMDNYVPTVRAVARSVSRMSPGVDNDFNTLISNYSTAFDDTPGNWPNSAINQLPYGEIFAKGLALKQNRQIGASPVGNANSTDAGKVLVVGNDGKIAMSTDNFQTEIPARATKIESTDSTYAPSVVTNGRSDGDVGQMAILTRRRVSAEDGADGNEFADYTNADSLIPTAAAVGAELSYKQTKKTCVGWPDGVEHTDANCWLWNMPD